MTLAFSSARNPPTSLFADPALGEVMRARLLPHERHKLIILLGSAPQAPRVKGFIPSGGQLWAINNAWRAVDSFDAFVFSDDFPANGKPATERVAKIGLSSSHYGPAMLANGGMIYCGATMAMAAGYLAIEAHPWSQIVFFASDMIYEGNDTHFYGQGRPDPLRSDMTLQSLEAKSLRLFYHGLLRGCLVLNGSEEKRSRLAVPSLGAAAFDASIRDKVADELPSLLAELAKPAAQALEVEAEAPFDSVRSDYGRLWEDESVWRYLAHVDELWLALAPIVDQSAIALLRAQPSGSAADILSAPMHSQEAEQS